MNVRKTLLILAAGLLLSVVVFGQAPNFSKIVVLGDSLSAGYYNGSLNENTQPKSCANLISESAGHPLTLPLFSFPGVPIAYHLQGFDPVTGSPVLKLDGTTMGSLMHPTTQPTNLAVPGQTSVDCYMKKPVIPPASLTDLILGFPSVYILGHPPASQVGLATQLSPTFVVIWIGANDVLGGAMTGNPNLTVPAAVFAQIYPAIVGTIAQTGAKMVLANIPDVTVVPALSLGADLKERGYPMHKLGVALDDYTTPYAGPHIKAIMQGKDPGPLGPGEVLRSYDVPKIQAILEADNQVIAAVAAQFHCPVVDMHGLFNKIKKHGYKLSDGTVLTADYLGGLFGLDGIHPTTTGQAVLAKEFIKAINAYYGTNLKAPKIQKVNRTDPDGFRTTPGVQPLDLPAEIYQEFVSSPSLQQQ